MPKETVYDQAAMYNMQVSWAREPAGYVQLGVETKDGRPIAEHLIEEPAPVAQILSEEQQQKEWEEDRAVSQQSARNLAQFTGLWGTLDREGCNRLIRVLRRARDQAFGADA